MTDTQPRPPADHADPQSVLCAFMDAMHAWETDAFSRLGRVNRPANRELEQAIRSEVAQSLDRIFAQYCTPRERKQGRQNCLAMGSPPDYDRTMEAIREIVQESTRRTVIYTSDTRPFSKEHAYVLLKRGGVWLLDSKKVKYTDGWEPYYL